MRTILTVVLYGKTYKDSQTLNSLMSKNFSDTNLLIINNGPRALEFDKSFIHSLGFYVKSVDIKEFVDNRPLSWLYNGVINEYRDYDRFVFFDDDSVIANDFIKKLDSYHTDSVDLQIPNVQERSNGRVYYPLVDKMVRKYNDGEIIESQNSVLSIGSGLVIYNSLVEKFAASNMEVFDNRFALYGVDYSFFNRIELLKKRGVSVSIQIVGVLDHSLSRVEESDNKWRSTERLYDSVLSVKYYSSNRVTLLLRIFKLACKQVIKLKFSNVELILKTFYKGKHPRC